MRSKWISILSLFLLAPVCWAKIQLVSTIPDLAWLAQEIGGEQVRAKALLKGRENPHYVDAVPDFIRQVSDADVVCQVGMDLEVGYLPAILARSGNAKIQSGGSGFCDVSKSIPVLEKPFGAIDRSMGDVHPFGNPHFYLSPTAMMFVADEIRNALLKVKPDQKDLFESGIKTVKARLQIILTANRDKLKTFQPEHMLVAEYHKEFVYFFNDYGFKSLGSVEEKPGVPPSIGRLSEFALAAKKAKVRFILAADYHSAKNLKRFEELSGIPVIQVPTLIQGELGSDAYASLQNQIVDKIVHVLTVVKK